MNGKVNSSPQEKQLLIINGYDPIKFHLGKLCKGNHSFLDTNKTLRDNKCCLCPQCKKEYSKNYLEKNKEYMQKYEKEYRKNNKLKIQKNSKIYHKIWYENNREDKLEKNRKWYENNKERKRATNKIWYENNREDKLKKNKEWKIKNKDKVMAITRKYLRKKRRTNKKYMLRMRMSIGISKSLKMRGGSKNSQHWENLVDYTLQDLMMHLESQFESWMNWNNYGSKWEIDHIVPISVFNFTSPDDYEFKLAWGLDNLQPLDSYINRCVKRDRLDYYVEFPIKKVV